MNNAYLRRRRGHQREFSTATLLLLAAILISTAACATKQRNKTLTEATATPYTATVPGSASTSTPPPSPSPADTATPTATAVPDNADVVDNGFATYENSLGDITVTWGAVVQNESVAKSVEDVKVTALFYDSSDVLIKTDSQDIVVIRPGQASATGSSYLTASATPVRMAVRLTHGDFVAGASTTNFTVSDVALKAGSYSATVEAQVTNPFDKDIENLEVVCIVSDGAGKYLGVGTSYLDLLPAATTALASCDIDSRLNVSGGTPQLYVALGNITSIDQ